MCDNYKMFLKNKTRLYRTRQFVEKRYFIKKNGKLLGYAVGAFLAQRQPFFHFVTFPLIGESPMCPPELRFLSNHIRYGNVGLPVPGAHAGAPLRLCQMLS